MGRNADKQCYAWDPDSAAWVSNFRWLNIVEVNTNSANDVFLDALLELPHLTDLALLIYRSGDITLQDVDRCFHALRKLRISVKCGQEYRILKAYKWPKLEHAEVVVSRDVPSDLDWMLMLLEDVVSSFHDSPLRELRIGQDYPWDFTCVARYMSPLRSLRHLRTLQIDISLKFLGFRMRELALSWPELEEYAVRGTRSCHESMKIPLVLVLACPCTADIKWMDKPQARKFNPHGLSLEKIRSYTIEPAGAGGDAGRTAVYDWPVVLQDPSMVGAAREGGSCSSEESLLQSGADGNRGNLTMTRDIVDGGNVRRLTCDLPYVQHAVEALRMIPSYQDGRRV
ncbi:uncharacterized protein FIBRA_03006 [Fibroporia radiculosa]|uniref:F-box domain-containing protein n=1 Tax=Fibroporia radiculosa TaxID=599839 RepID=J4G3S7_9APHY|nr:uncharacterized protein FIBRA_03006 [Fibroporia radiculosa]CCM00958.1 predicted protein [Fibroporia radiculosa]